MNSLDSTPVLEEKLLLSIGENLLELEEGFGVDDDLFEAGLDSMSIMQLLLIIEEEFGVLIPVGELSRGNLSSIRSVAALVREKQAEPGAAV